MLRSTEQSASKKKTNERRIKKEIEKKVFVFGKSCLFLKGSESGIIDELLERSMVEKRVFGKRKLIRLLNHSSILCIKMLYKNSYIRIYECLNTYTRVFEHSINNAK